jgi:hypothetical protein
MEEEIKEVSPSAKESPESSSSQLKQGSKKPNDPRRSWNQRKLD